MGISIGPRDQSPENPRLWSLSIGKDSKHKCSRKQVRFTLLCPSFLDKHSVWLRSPTMLVRVDSLLRCLAQISINFSTPWHIRLESLIVSSVPHSPLTCCINNDEKKERKSKTNKNQKNCTPQARQRKATIENKKPQQPDMAVSWEALPKPDKYRGRCPQPTTELSAGSLMEELEKRLKELRGFSAP